MKDLTLHFINLQNRTKSFQFKKLWVLDSFSDKSQEKVIMAEMPNYEKYLTRKDKVIQDRANAPVDSLFMYEEPFLDKDQEKHLFRQYNFLKFKYKQLSEIKPNIAKLPQVIKNLEKYAIQISEVKKTLICSNVRLVVNLAKKFNTLDYQASVSDGWTGLAMAVDYFDFRRELKFITYAYLVIKDHIRKNNLKNLKEYSCTNTDDNFIEYQPDKTNIDDLVCLGDVKDKIQKSLRCITPRERMVISFYYGLDCPEHTLDEIGQKLKISKERVRQIKVQGIEKLKKSPPKL